MRFSLLTFVTVVSFLAVVMGAIRMQAVYREAFIVFGTFGFLVTILVLAMLTPVRDGKLDMEQNEPLKILFPAFKLLLALAALALLSGFLYGMTFF